MKGTRACLLSEPWNWCVTQIHCSPAGPSPNTSPQKPLQMPLTQISPRPSQAGDSPQPQASVNGTNEALMWELLYNLDFEFPSTALDLMWSDAIGATHVMQVRLPLNLREAMYKNTPL